MSKRTVLQATEVQFIEALQRRREGLKLHEIEGNPLDAEDLAMFEMFDREGWSHERRLAYIKDKFTAAPVPSAAE